MQTVNGESAITGIKPDRTRNTTIFAILIGRISIGFSDPSQVARTSMQLLQRQAVRVLAGLFIIYGTLVATHEGEFWPFSIFPMFSTAGQPWVRAIVHELPPDLEDDAVWQPGTPEELPGKVVPLVEHGLFQNDLANYVSKTPTWTPERLEGIRAMFEGRIASDERMMIYYVRGELQPDGVDVRAWPLILLSGSEVELVPGFEEGAFR